MIAVILTHDEYKSMKETFLDLYRDDLKSMLLEKKKQHLEYSMKNVTWGNFFKKYTSGFGFLLLIALLSLAKATISMETVAAIAIFALLHLLGFYEAFYEWKKDMHSAALATFCQKENSIVRDFIYEKMLEEIHDLNESKFERIVQFYCIALYDIPKNVSFITYDDLK